MYDEFDRQPGKVPSEWRRRLRDVDRAGFRLHRLMALYHSLARAKALLAQEPDAPGPIRAVTADGRDQSEEGE